MPLNTGSIVSAIFAQRNSQTFATAKQKTSGKSLIVLFIASFYGGSVEGVRGPLRRGIHGPGVSVFGSPHVFSTL